METSLSSTPTYNPKTPRSQDEWKKLNPFLTDKEINDLIKNPPPANKLKGVIHEMDEDALTGYPPMK